MQTWDDRLPIHQQLADILSFAAGCFALLLVWRQRGAGAAG